MVSFSTRQQPAVGLRWCPPWAGKPWQRPCRGRGRRWYHAGVPDASRSARRPSRPLARGAGRAPSLGASSAAPLGPQREAQCEKTCAVPSGTAPILLSHTPRLQERYGPQAGRWRLASRLLGRWLQGRRERRARWRWESRALERARGESRWVRSKVTGRALGASVLVFHRQRPRSRPRRTPGGGARTVARACPRHGAWREP